MFAEIILPWGGGGGDRTIVTGVVAFQRVHFFSYLLLKGAN